jgi:Mg-chelatase subunit ChlD
VLDEDALSRGLAEDPNRTLALLVDMAGATDERLRAAARDLAGRIVLDRARSGTPRGRGIGRLRSVPADAGGDLDLDASLGAVVEARAVGRAPGLDELTARTWARPTLALCLVIDASGSMAGDRLAAAALTTAACAWRAPGDYAVLAFAREVVTVRAMDALGSPDAVVRSVLGLRGHGVTGLAAALRAADEQLARTRAARRVVVLLSDCRATDGEDPVPVGARLPELLILAPAEGSEQAADLAARTGARWAPITGASDAPAALLDLLTR